MIDQKLRDVLREAGIISESDYGSEIWACGTFRSLPLDVYLLMRKVDFLADALGFEYNEAPQPWQKKGKQ